MLRQCDQFLVCSRQEVWSKSLSSLHVSSPPVSSQARCTIRSSWKSQKKDPFRFSPSDLFSLKLVRSTTTSASTFITNHNKTSMEQVMRVESFPFQHSPISAPLTSSLPKLSKRTDLPSFSRLALRPKRNHRDTEKKQQALSLVSAIQITDSESE